MGGCCSSDSIPDPPEIIMADPEIPTAAKIVTAPLGYWGMSRDYGVWKDEYPGSYSEAKKKIWLWFNKVDHQGTKRIDLENFVRTNPEAPKKGQVLYFMVLGVPTSQYMARPGLSGNLHYNGILNPAILGPYASPIPDNVFLARTHQGAYDSFMIEKFQITMTSQLHDGNTGRGAQTIQSNQILMTCCALGTIAVVRWHTMENVPIHDSEGRVVGHRQERRDHYRANKFIDRVEIRITSNGVVWSEWWYPGDSYDIQGTVTFSSPFFDASVEGGWFTRSKFTIQTKPGVDPAIAILLAHMSCTEYSISDMKEYMAPRC